MISTAGIPGARSGMFQLRPTFRFLVRHPALVLTAIATISLAVAANSLVFSLIQAVLIRPLPFRKPDRLVQLWQTHPALGNLPLTYPDYLDWKRARAFESVETYTFQATNKVTLTGAGAPEQLQATMVSSGLFPQLVIPLALGRNFTPLEEHEKQPVVLISESLWRRKYHSDPAILGRAIRIPPLHLTVIGVVKQPFPAWADLWLPLSMLGPELTGARRFHPLEVVARLKPGVTLAQAQTELTAIAARNAAAYSATNRTMGAFATALLQQVTRPARPVLLLLWMAVALILLMSAANVAHLLLTRTAGRRREFDIRIALGATWAAVAKLLAVESLLLAAAGGVLGTGAAIALLPLLRRIAQSRIPRIEELRFDWPVALYTAGAAALLGIATALPSLAAALRRHPAPNSRRNHRPGSLLIVSEIALSFVVLGSALLLARSFNTLLAVDPGFDGRHVLALEVRLPPSPDGWESAARLFENALAPAVRALPGVEQVAAANMAPMSLGRTETSRWATRFGIGQVSYRDGAFPVAQIRFVTPDYFRVLKIPLLRGRGLTQADRSQPAWLINETLARQFFPGRDPVGRQLVSDVGTPRPTPVTIAGVVGDVRDLSLDTPPQPTIYVLDTSPGLTLLIRAAGNPLALAPAVQDVVHRLAPEAPVTAVHTVETLMGESLARYRFALQLMLVFAAAAALLSVLGIYGVAAYSVARRTREFGVRTALGATPGRLIALVASEGLRGSLAGIALGLILFAFASRLFRGLLYQVSALDPAALAGGAALLVACSLLALAIPARRASTVHPNIALKQV